jgi:hypothetical protein
MRLALRLLGGLAVLFGAVLPVVAQAPELAMLDGLQDGSWEIRIRGEEASRNICLRTGRELIQIRHQSERCSRFVVDDGATEVTVQYSCPGNGYGRTTIRRETPQLVQINSQGIEKNLPFHFNAEARRAGAC